MEQLTDDDTAVFNKIQAIKNTIAIERYGQALKGLSKEQKNSVSMDAVEQYFKGALLYGRTGTGKERLEKLSFEELLKETKK